MARKAQTRASGNTADAPAVNSKIELDELITVVSLIDYPLNLLDAGRRGKYRFTSFGEVKQIIYQDVLEIIERYRTFIDAGYFMILDERVIDRHGIRELQSKNLNRESINKILNSSTDAFKLFESCGMEQQKLIAGMITRRIAEKPDSVDLNLVDRIGRHLSVNILENAEDMRFLYGNKEKETA